ncbi:4-demethylwyosine synthase TYW1 [Candidatus Woesearchaeota archaeon]|nr:4-demethylwyosine synthase TYW1 [Candidatus Woesearchaeota archaeon]
MSLPIELKKLLQKQHYSFIGNHSAIKICTWTKKSLLDQDFCYKQKFYNIKSHLCCQLSTTIGFCQNRCILCWRPTEYTIGTTIKNEDNPKELIQKATKAQQKQISGFKGNKLINLKKFKEAQEPKHFAISLSGEPLIYKNLNKLIKELKKQNKTTFIVTNGLLPNRLKNLEPPTQLYLSLDAPNKNLFEKIDKPVIKNAWKKLNKSLEILKELKNKTRTVLRITLIKNLNMIEPENYAKLIKKADPDFIEIKSYMWVGYSQQRLSIKNMPLHNEIKDFAKEILKHLKNYKLINEKKESRVILLSKNKNTKI